MLYTALAWSSRRAMRWCYRDVVVAGEVPSDGPVLLAVNHPNDLPDICAILGHVRRRVHFVANVSAAEQPLVSWAYARMGVVPVHRVRDARRAKARGENSAEANERAFARVRDLLSCGECVCVFPEGGVHRGPHLGTLRTGLARMALDARDAAGLRGIRIVPVGLNYEAPLVFRSRVLIEVGRPIELDTWTTNEGRRAESQLTVVIGAALRSVTRNAPDEVCAEALSAAALVAAAVAPAEALVSGTAMWRSLHGEVYGPGIAREANEDPRVVPAIDLLRDLRAVATHESPVLLLRAWSEAPRTRSLLGLAVVCAALPGLALHAPAWTTVRWLASGAATSADELIPRTIIPGLYLMVAWYVVLAIGFWAVFLVLGVGGWTALGVSLLALCAAPALGDVAMRWLDRVGDRRRRRLLAREVPDLAARVDVAVRALHAPASARSTAPLSTAFAAPHTSATQHPAHNEREVI